MPRSPRAFRPLNKPMQPSSFSLKLAVDEEEFEEPSSIKSTLWLSKWNSACDMLRAFDPLSLSSVKKDGEKPLPVRI